MSSSIIWAYKSTPVFHQSFLISFHFLLIRRSRSLGSQMVTVCCVFAVVGVSIPATFLLRVIPISPPISSLPPRLLLSNKGSYATKHNLATCWRKQAVVKRFGMLFKSYHMALPWHYIPHAGSGICLSSSWNNSSQQRRQSVPQNRKLDRNRSSHFIPNKNKARATREH